MLNHLHIRHFAIIDNTELELQAGMTALTGETGAGKSILLDALGQVLGARGSVDNIQQDEQRSEVTASFDIDNLPAVIKWLQKNDLDEQNECLLRRIYTRNGKGRATINDRPVSLQLMRELGRLLVSIHGQNEHHTLAQPTAQRSLLDAYSKSKLPSQVAQAFDDWQAANKQLLAIRNDSADHQNRIDLLQFQLQEFDSLDISGLSITDIESEHRWLANADKLLQLCSQTLASLESESGAESALAKTIPPLTELVGIDDRLQEALDLIESAHIQSAEAAAMVRQYASSMDHDENRLQWLDERLASLHKLAKKHLVEISVLDQVEHKLREELDSMTSPEARVDKLEIKVDALQRVYRDQAAKLTRLRKQSAKKLSADITASMQTLAMSGSELSIQINSDKTALSRHGFDTVQFNVSPNPGVAPSPMSKIASGGELSRISLCVQLATIDAAPVPTLIFDEVDAGVGGATAETVGQLLRQVGTKAQVLCVTHLPQVAAQAHNHMRVKKSVEDENTRTQLESLDNKQTRDEIARMLGGAKITAKTRQHAQEMLNNAEEA